MIRLLLLIDSSTEFSRQFLKGFVNYTKDKGSWTFFRLPAYYRALYGEQGILAWIQAWKIDAVIAQWEYEDVSFLEKLKIPVFLQNYKDENICCSKITGEYKQVGTMAAQFFIKKRFRNFAFYGHKDFYWSRARAEGYRKEIEKIGGNYHYFESELLNNNSWSEDHIRLNDWLVSLPKPVGLFACDDIFALQVSEMCKISEINIPKELSLLGVDNDELICSLTYPSISSIVTDDFKGGYETGRMLHHQIVNKKNVPFNISIAPTRIELRQSTEKYNITDDNILKVVNYIEENISLNIAVDNLVTIVPLSRRNLELKFKEIMGTTVYQFILDSKIDFIKDQLLTTDKDILDIAFEAGFNDVRSVYRVFRKATGFTPMEFRKNLNQFVG